jgi:mRNA turnover protein 4
VQKDETLSKEQAQLLKLIGVQMAVFKVTLAGRWSEDEGWVEMSGLEPSSAKGDDGGEEEEMDDD